MILKMGIFVGILVLTGLVAWIGISALCVYVLSLYVEMWRGPEATYHENSTFRRPPRVSKRLYNRIRDKYRPSNSPVDLDYDSKYLVLFEKKLDGQLEYVCFPQADLEPGMSSNIIKFKLTDSYKSVLLDLRSNSWVAVKSI